METITISFHSNELEANNVKTCLNSESLTVVLLFLNANH